MRCFSVSLSLFGFNNLITTDHFTIYFAAATQLSNSCSVLMTIHRILRTIVFLQLVKSCVTGQQLDPPSLSGECLLDTAGTRWALLVAGSRGYGNYRHQADVCHAFQILKNGGLGEENIIVFMYDDIAFHSDNPMPGVVINSPNGDNVYEGVPKDYTGKNATVQNLFAVMLANKSGLTVGSGKILDGGPNNHIFIYYSDHGSPGTVEISSGEIVYADDLITVLEACESGSMFDGLLPETLNIYAITAANPTEDSFAAYCPDDYPFVSPAYGVCLGDVYSVAWMEDSERHDLRSETLGQQLQVVRRRTAVDDSHGSSHVMQYGSRLLGRDTLNTYLGTISCNDNYTGRSKSSAAPSTLRAVSQREADLLYYRHKLNIAPEGSIRRLEAQNQLVNEISSRMLVDNRVKQICTIIFGAKRGIAMLNTVRPGGEPLVDDWSCLKTFVKTYEEHCGPLSTYGRKYVRVMANMCNAMITVDQMNMAVARVCK